MGGRRGVDVVEFVGQVDQERVVEVQVANTVTVVVMTAKNRVQR